jgi:hypothetical protein
MQKAAAEVPRAEPPPLFPKLTARANVGGSTPQRDAIDALISGNEAEARRLYEQLAVKTPNEPAYVEAARILKRRNH